MIGYRICESMTVRRVKDGPHRSHVEPRLNPMWSRRKKLSWNAAVIKADQGVTITVIRYNGLLHRRRWRINIGSHNLPYRTFTEAWHEMDGIALGFQLGQESSGTRV